MEEFKGTPGMWGFSHSSASDSNVACIEITSSESLHEVAYLQSTPLSIGSYEQTSFDRTIANAHLIASAPELLELVIHIKNCLHNDGQYEPAKLDYIDKRLAKALGK